MKVQPSSNSVLGSHTQVFTKIVTLRTLASHWLILSLGLGYSSQYCMYLYTLFISSQHIPLAGHDRFCRVSQVQVCLTVLLSEIVQCSIHIPLCRPLLADAVLSQHYHMYSCMTNLTNSLL